MECCSCWGEEDRFLSDRSIQRWHAWFIAYELVSLSINHNGNKPSYFLARRLTWDRNKDQDFVVINCLYSHQSRLHSKSVPSYLLTPVGCFLELATCSNVGFGRQEEVEMDWMASRSTQECFVERVHIEHTEILRRKAEDVSKMSNVYPLAWR